jgi:hypothetical protein
MLRFEEAAKARLAGAPVPRADETGVGTGGRTDREHVAADKEFSFFSPHAGRGREGAEVAGSRRNDPGKAAGSFFGARPPADV